MENLMKHSKSSILAVHSEQAGTIIGNRMTTLLMNFKFDPNDSGHTIILGPTRSGMSVHDSVSGLTDADQSPRPRMAYSSATTWQAEQYEVEIRFGEFRTIDEAAAMGRSGIKGILLDEAGMWVVLAEGNRSPVRTDGIIVRRLRPAADQEAARRSLTIDDFEVVAMTLDEMRDVPQMRSFGSQAYGVVDTDGNPVAMALTD
jgi:hypothetical protein